MSVDIHDLAEQARAMGYRTSGQLISRLERMLIRNESYLSRRAALGRRTAYDEVLAEDCAVIGLVIQMLEEAK
jgi:hypothetical protein